VSDNATEVDTEPRAETTAAKWRPVVITAVVLILFFGLIALVSGPARGMRADIARQRDLIEAQLSITKMQLEIAKDQQNVSHETLDIARQQLALAEQMRGKTDESLALQRQLLAIAQQTLATAQEINRKTPNVPGLVTPGKQ
jgi:uncharacterized protein (DUF3084 family)